MMLMDNLIHSDLHPGNILVRLTPPGGPLGVLYNCLDSIKRSHAVRQLLLASYASVCMHYACTW
jgi:predicted unusual protein kinase regulating ubiquinone biosynthesis (AarF/ABC1/UbiB family)